MIRKTSISKSRRRIRRTRRLRSRKILEIKVEEL